MAALSLCVAAALCLNQPSGSEGQTEEPLQLYLDRDLSRPYSGQFFSGANLERGENTWSLWLHNTAPYPLRELSLISLLPGNLALTWNCQNYTLQPGERKEATLTLILGSQISEGEYLLGARFYILYATEEGILDEV